MEDKNFNRQSRWEDVIAADQDYDGEFLIKLVVHKLGLMINYFLERYNKLDPNLLDYDQDRADISKIIRTLKNSHELGTKVLEYNYGEAADKLFEEKGDPSWVIESSEEEDYLEWDRLCKEAAETRRKDIEKLFRNIGKNIDTWWI